MPWEPWIFSSVYQRAQQASQSITDFTASASSLHQRAQQWFYGDGSNVSSSSGDSAEVAETVKRVLSRDNFPDMDSKTLEAKRQKWEAVLRSFQRYGRYSTGNRVTILEGGDACFTEMLSRIGSAHTRVWCESYIFDNSP